MSGHTPMMTKTWLVCTLMAALMMHSVHVVAMSSSPASMSQSSSTDATSTQSYSSVSLTQSTTSASTQSSRVETSTPSAQSSTTAQRRHFDVLMVGNSLTYTNNLPRMLKRLAESSQDVDMDTSQSTAGAVAFIEHAQDPSDYSQATRVRTIEKIRSQRWNVVVLQEQSGSWFYLQPKHLESYGKPILDDDGDFTGEYDPYPFILDREVRDSGAITMMFQTWPPESSVNEATQREIEAAFDNVAAQLFAFVAPIGAAFLRAVQDYDVDLYADEVHPSLLGTYLAACVVYTSITGESPVGLSDAGTGLDADLVTRMQQTAYTAFLEYKRRAQAKCSVEGCVRFVAGSASLPPLPTSPPQPISSTSHHSTQPTTTDTPCELLHHSADLHFFESDLVEHSQIQQLSYRLARSQCHRYWRMCFNATEHGWSSSTFHARCDNRGATLTIVRIGHPTLHQQHNGRIFGGYTPEPWTSRGASVEVDGVWLYRFSPDNFLRLEAFDVDASDGRSMYDYNSRCPTLGRNGDLTLLDDCRTGFSVAHDDEDYTPSGYDDRWLAGTHVYVADAVEVFYAYDPDQETTATATATAPDVTTTQQTDASSEDATSTPSTSGTLSPTASVPTTTSVTEQTSSSSASQPSSATTTSSMATSSSKSGAGTSVAPPGLDGTTSTPDEEAPPTQPSSKSHDNLDTIAIAIAVACGVLLLVLVGVAVIYRQTRRGHVSFQSSISGASAFDNPLFMADRPDPALCNRPIDA